MEKIKEYLSNPGTRISFIVFVFALGVGYKSITDRIEKLEKFQETINIQEIQTTLAQIQTDIQWIKQDLQKK